MTIVYQIDVNSVYFFLNALTERKLATYSNKNSSEIKNTNSMKSNLNNITKNVHALHIKCNSKQKSYKNQFKKYSCVVTFMQMASAKMLLEK
jgi:NAD-dependent SIR2 family protein deacetylase